MPDPWPDILGFTEALCLTGDDFIHCGHLTGRSWSYGVGAPGGADVQCCHCGVTVEITRTEQTERVEGHGPYFTVSKIRYEWPEGWRDGDSDA